MKKIIAILLAAALMLSLAACSESKPEPTEAPSSAETTAPMDSSSDEQPTETSAEPSDTANGETLGQTLRAAFLDAMDKNPEATPLELAETLIGNPVIQFAPITEPVVPGFLPGFSADIDGFAEGAMFAPMIGSIAFVGYVFRLEDGADADAFTQLLKDNADPSWNICVTAEETVIDHVGNTVFFVMCPGNAD